MTTEETTTPADASQPDEITYTELFDDKSAGPGAMVWWTLKGTRIKPDTMRALLIADGMDASIVKSIEQDSAVKRAARAWKGSDKTDSYQSVISYDGPDRIVVGIQKFVQVTPTRADWQQIDAVEFDVILNRWLSTGSIPEAAEYVAFADILRTHLDHTWIRPKLLKPRLEAIGFTLRPGVFFVPAQKLSEAGKLQGLVRQIGSCSLDIAHVAPTADSQAALGTAARDGIDDALHDPKNGIMARIQKWTERTRRVSESQADKMLEELQDLRNRAELYADALKIRIDDLTEAVDEATAEARRILDDQEEGQPAKSAPSAPSAFAGSDPFAAAAAAGWIDASATPDTPATAPGARPAASGSIDGTDAPSDEVAPEPGDEAADMRERLAAKTTDEVIKTYLEVVGDGPADLNKGQMISAIVDQLVA